MHEYYAAAVQCNKAKLKDNMPDFTTMQRDGITPACYYNIKAQKASAQKSCRNGHAAGICTQTFQFSDF